MFKMCLILKTCIHIFLLILMTILTFGHFENSNLVGSISGVISCLCWAILLIFYDIPDFKKLKKTTKDKEEV